MQQVVNGDEIAEAFRHLLAFDLQKTVVHPDIGHDVMAKGAAGLGDFILVMREDEVDAAAVNVKDLAEMLCRHGRAFDMPARTAATPGAVPARLVVLRRLPQHEIHLALLVGRDFDAGAGDHVVERAARQLAVIGHGGHVEQHMAVGRIGVAVGDQLFDDRDHLGDMFGGARLHVGRQAAQRRDVLLKDAIGLFGQLADGDAALGGAGVDLVVHVGDVADIFDMFRAVFFAQKAIQHVEDDQRPRIADMGEVIDGRAADIEPHV